jgi:hypothetical protein
MSSPSILLLPAELQLDAARRMRTGVDDGLQPQMHKTRASASDTHHSSNVSVRMRHTDMLCVLASAGRWGGNGHLRLRRVAADQRNDLFYLHSCHTLTIQSQESIAHAHPAIWKGAAFRIDVVDDEGQHRVRRNGRAQDYANAARPCSTENRTHDSATRAAQTVNARNKHCVDTQRA